MIDRSNTRRRYLIIASLVIITIGSFMGVMNNGFINYDDPAYVVNNEHVRTGLSLPTIVWAFSSTSESNWHPITWLSHSLDCSLFGMDPRYHHAMNLFIHLLTTIMVFLVFEKMTRMPWQSAFIAVVFAVHPLHVESVAWISERKDALSGFFWIATMIAYVNYARSSALKWYIITILLFILGLMSKPMLVSLPFVLLLLDYWPLGRIQIGKSLPGEKSIMPPISRKRIIVEKIPFLVLAIVSSVLTFFIQQHGGSMAISSRLPMDERLTNAIVTYIQYIGKIFIPTDLAIFYPHPLGTLESYKIIGAIVIILSITFFVWKNSRTDKYLMTGWLWFIGTLIPVIGIVQVGLQSMADRYMYIPIIGIAIIIAWGVPQLINRFKLSNIIPKAGFALIVPLMMLGTYIQTTYWKSNVTLFQHALAVTTNNHIAHTNLGVDLADSGRHAEAIPHLREAMRLWPNEILTHSNLARSLVAIGERKEALNQYNWILERTPTDPRLHNRIADVLADEGDLNGAIDHYHEAFRLDSAFLMSRCKVGKLLAQQSKYDEAKAQCEYVLRKDSGFSMAHDILGIIAGQQKLYDEALKEFAEAIRLDSTNADAYNDLGIVYDNLGKEADAFQMYQRAVHFNDEQWNAQFNLGTMYARRGQLSDAAIHLERAVTLFPTALDARSNLARVYAHQGNFPAAAEQFAAIIKYDPGNASAHFQYGSLLVKQNKLREASVQFQETLRLDPAFKDAQIALEKIQGIGS
jgi:protein O-mannosyl-transferase